MHILIIEPTVKKPARNSPKEKRGASGGFLPKPLLFHLRHPNSEKRNQPKFCVILFPENSFRKTSSALFPFHSLGFSAKWVLTFSNKHHIRQSITLACYGLPYVDPRGFELYEFSTPCRLFISLSLINMLARSSNPHVKHSMLYFGSTQ